ncbi:MAG TPA: 16S rRNA (guanine(527)-N(7))-methyltransferase RsmG [Firmicutes bacterium]|jgi:16S rRNA (guanine527-N7)-methyltransferase|nr:16S rRNA (guanine(527)-N(7))-methyltransferase RsmG [Bacillota bacterium]
MRELAPILENIAKMLDLKLNNEQKRQLLRYIALILEGLTRQRLVGETRGDILVEKHLFDCLYPLKLWRLTPPSLLDLGTGAGLPGIPLKICLPGTELYLLDAARRKINFLRRVAAELALQGTYFMPGRAERWGHHPRYREKFDCVVSRAVAGAAVLAELALPLVRVGGELLLYKGKGGPEEIEEAGASIRLCGGRLERCGRYRLPTGEERTLFAIKKIEATAAAYPRREGRAAKKPLGS